MFLDSKACFLLYGKRLRFFMFSDDITPRSGASIPFLLFGAIFYVEGSSVTTNSALSLAPADTERKTPGVV